MAVISLLFRLPIHKKLVISGFVCWSWFGGGYCERGQEGQEGEASRWSGGSGGPLPPQVHHTIWRSHWSSLCWHDLKRWQLQLQFCYSRPLSKESGHETMEDGDSCQRRGAQAKSWWWWCCYCCCCGPFVWTNNWPHTLTHTSGQTSFFFCFLFWFLEQQNQQKLFYLFRQFVFENNNYYYYYY